MMSDRTLRYCRLFWKLLSKHFTWLLSAITASVSNSGCFCLTHVQQMMWVQNRRRRRFRHCSTFLCTRREKPRIVCHRERLVSAPHRGNVLSGWSCSCDVCHVVCVCVVLFLWCMSSCVGGLVLFRCIMIFSARVSTVKRPRFSFYSNSNLT